MRAAKYWGLHPREWRAETVDDRATMYAIYLFEATLEARRMEYRKEQSDRAESNRGGRDSNTFSKLKSRLKA